MRYWRKEIRASTNSKGGSAAENESSSVNLEAQENLKTMHATLA
jgi:hypothetical protein